MCNVSEPPAVHLFENEQNKPAIVHSVSIASDACDAITSGVLLLLWANSLTVGIEVNLIDARATLSLELTTI